MLLVEDDLIEVELLADSMRDQGTVHLHDEVATTLADAVAALEGEPFDAVLLDLSLPDSQGLATVTTLVETHPDVPVVVLTGTEDDRLAAAAIEAGAQDYLVKGSVTPEVLVRVVRHAKERHALLADLQLREQRFRTMAESAQDAIYRLRTRPAFAFEYLNPAVARLSGFRLEQFHADPGLYLERVHEADRWKLELDGLDPATPARTVTVRFRRADGEWIVLKDDRTPIVEDGVVVGVQGLVRDVTAQQRTTKALHDALWAEQRAAEELRATDALKGQFLQAVSHELRTPLTSIIGFAETLVDSIDLMEPAGVLLFHERILANANRLRLLTTDLLDLEVSHDELQVHRVESDVTAIAERVTQGVAVGSRHVGIDGTRCVATVDPGMVERILHKLLANVVKHTPQGTAVTVRCTRDDDVARISVIDDGPGVPEHCRERAFEPFWQGLAMQGDPSPGTGVGLALVRQFAELHGGHAWIEDTPGGGTTVHVELAVTEPREEGDHDAIFRPTVSGRAPEAGEDGWRYLAAEHRRSLQQAMAELLHTPDAMDASDVILDHLLRGGAEVVDDPSDGPAHVTVGLDPDVAPVHVTHADAAVRASLRGQVEILTAYGRQALATRDLRGAFVGTDPAAVDGATVVLWATRELLAAGTVEEVVGIVLRAVHGLGGAVLPARLEDEASLPLDLTFGCGAPLVPVAGPGSVARTLLQRHLPGLVADARAAADRLGGRGRPDGDAGTGLVTRQELHRLVTRLGGDDVVVAVDLHGLRDGALGDADVEDVVRGFANCLREQVRAGDHVARVGFDEFALLLRGADRPGALQTLERLRARWEQVRPRPVAFSAGVAVAAEHDPQALHNIEQALYLARSGGTGARPHQDQQVAR